MRQAASLKVAAGLSLSGPWSIFESDGEKTHAEIRNTDLLIFQFLLGSGIRQFSALYDQCLGSRVSAGGQHRESTDSREGSRGGESQSELLERPQGGHGEAQDGFWTITTPPLVPGFNYYTLIIDGTEVSDPNTHAFFGGGKPASAVEVP